MTYGRTSGVAAYGRVANAEVDPLQQLVMLYEGAIKFLRLSAGDIESGDLAAKAEHTNRALDIVVYLQSILDFEQGGEVAGALDALYSNVAATTLRASAALDATEMRRAADLLAPVRDAWAANVTASSAAKTYAPAAQTNTNAASISFAIAI